jgi:hypothetical protein
MGKAVGMKTSSAPRPNLAFFSALIALVAYLLAPDVKEVALICALYGAAVVNVLLVRAWLTAGSGEGDRKTQLNVLLVGGLAEALLFVGAGYCTSVEPGVIKLGGVLPLGWSCAVLALIDGSLGLFAVGQGSAVMPVQAQAERWLLLAIGTLIALGERVLHQEPVGLKGILTAVLGYTVFTIWRRYRQISTVLDSRKD